MAVMTMVAWERADESGGFSVARRERLEPPDAGWLFHGTEVLVDVLQGGVLARERKGTRRINSSF